MPNRFIKESICTSESIDALTPWQETCFYRLIVNCDDFGRFDARPKVLSSRLYPLRSVPVEDIQEALDVFVRLDMIFIYEVEGKKYLQVKNWLRYQQKRATTSKYPDPVDTGIESSDNNGNQPISSDNKRCDNDGYQVISDDNRCPRNSYSYSYNDKRVSESDNARAMISDDDATAIQRDHDRILEAAKGAGFKGTDAERAKLLNLYTEYGNEKMLAAIDECVTHSASNIAYLTAVLKGTPKADKTYNRDYSKDQDAAFDRLVKMGRKTDARDVHGYEQRDYSGEQKKAMERMMTEEWPDDPPINNGGPMTHKEAMERMMADDWGNENAGP